VLQLTENRREEASGDPKLEAIVPNTKIKTENEDNSIKIFCQKIFPEIQKNITNQVGLKAELFWPQETRR
jgi:hypothetical protein